MFKTKGIFQSMKKIPLNISYCTFNILSFLVMGTLWLWYFFLLSFFFKRYFFPSKISLIFKIY